MQGSGRLDRTGEILGHFRLMKLLGKGGYAEVYLAENIHLGTQVAIKVLRARVLQDYEQEQLRTEAGFMMSLDHPHIIRVIDFGIEISKRGLDVSTPYLVMEYAPLGTLRHLYPRGTSVPLPKVVFYIKQVAEALQYAHDQNIVHHDVKPENMLVRRPDDVALSDFGIAVTGNNTGNLQIQIQEIAEKVARKEQVTIPGTAAYLAPERLQGHTQRASDQYSLAIVAYEWLCGHPPFDGNDLELCNKHVHATPQSLSQTYPHIPQDVDRVIMKGLRKHPGDRYETVLKFALALENAARSPAPRPVPVPPLPQPVLSSTVLPSRLDSPPPALDSQRRIPSERLQDMLNTGRQSLNALGYQDLPTQAEEDPSVTASRGPSTKLFPDSRLPKDELKELFISYNRADRSWAEWITWKLESAGITCILLLDDFHQGSNFKLEMQKAFAKARRILLVLSPDYLKAYSNQSRWAIPSKRNTMEAHDALLLVRVRECGSKYRKLLESTNYIDIAGMNEEAAYSRLLTGIRGDSITLMGSPSFPGNTLSHSSELPQERPPFPNKLLSTFQVSKDMLTRALSSNIAPSTSIPPTSLVSTDQALMKQVNDAFAEQDWHDVIRKTEHLIKRNPDAVSSEIYHMQGKALFEEGELQPAYEALHMALTLVSNREQRLTLLHDYTTVLIALNRWDDVLSCTREALRLAPNNPEWLALQQQALAQQQSAKIASPVVIRPPQPQPIPRPQVHPAPQGQTQQATQSIEVFFSYCRKDEKLRSELEIRLSTLKRQGLTTWHDHEIPPGKVWSEEIDAHLGAASIILLLISPYFMASPYCFTNEMQRAMERHEAGKARVIPIILRPTDLEGTPFAKLQALPKDAKPVTMWTSREEALHDIVMGIRRALNELTKNT